MITLGSETLKRIRAQNPGLAANWDAQPRLVGYVGTQAELDGTYIPAPPAPQIPQNIVLLAPYTVFFVVTYPSSGPQYVINATAYLPRDLGGSYSTVVPTQWEPQTPNLDPVNFNIEITGNNIIDAYYKIPRGLAVDRVAVPTSEGLMFFATDTKELYMFTGGAWVLISKLVSAEILGLMYGWSDVLPLPSSDFLRCDGSFVPATDYPDLLSTFTQGGFATSPFENPLNPPPAGSFTLPLQANTIIRALS